MRPQPCFLAADARKSSLCLLKERWPPFPLFFYAISPTPTFVLILNQASRTDMDKNCRFGKNRCRQTATMSQPADDIGNLLASSEIEEAGLTAGGGMDGSFGCVDLFSKAKRKTPCVHFTSLPLLARRRRPSTPPSPTRVTATATATAAAAATFAVASPPSFSRQRGRDRTPPVEAHPRRLLVRARRGPRRSGLLVSPQPPRRRSQRRGRLHILVAREEARPDSGRRRCRGLRERSAAFGGDGWWRSARRAALSCP